MTDATDLWADVVTSYDTQSLVELTNIHDRSATTITTAVGEDAALGALNLWEAYAQVAYDKTNALHVEVGKRATVAMLWERGGSASQIAKQEWDEVFTDGLVERLKRTGPRSRQGPSSNSAVTQSSELLSDGTRPRPWSDSSALPRGILPSSRSSADA